MAKIEVTKINSTFSKLLIDTNRKGMKELLEHLDKNNFCEVPASIKHHGNYNGGLITHSMNVYNLYYKLCNKFSVKIPHDSIIICSLLHDVCKAFQYKKVNDKWCYNKDAIKNHALYSIKIIKEFIELTETEERIIKHHMGMYKLPMSFDNGEYELDELIEAFNHKEVKLFYFCDDICAQFIDGKQ